ncbi:MAG: glutamine synthetase III [Erysipelotrichaceae bacterium]|nr:glutamine synthetase III [Erysipelotrichaceae bacterium]
MYKVEDYFACNVFSRKAMEKYLPNSIYQQMLQIIDGKKILTEEIADIAAEAMKEWALDLGATHYTHWFQPMTGITAEKHDAFIHPANKGEAISRFKGKELIKSEPDASSFPNGGLRATFEARGYTAWDPTSFAFVKDKTLYIPTMFFSYDGSSLDKKTPLIRSLDALSKAATRLFSDMGCQVDSISTSVGPEQEYFLIDKKYFDQRMDLQITGRTLFGAPPVKGQELDDHYFGSIPGRVKAFMEDVNEELWKLGVYAKTEHKEVAPGQFELAPVFTSGNVSCDQNQITMEVLQKTALKHDLVCLLHEKPFAGVNGSGKHNNWSFTMNDTINLLEPGSDPEGNLRFLTVLAAIIKGVDEYQDLLRLSTATAGNDHRLGAHEAPPAIISIFLGDDLTAILKAIADETDYVEQTDTHLDLGVSVLPPLPKDTTDRNRTSPFAFTGNKFEFRMLGSSLNISCPNTILNTIVAEEFMQFADELEAFPKEQAIERCIGLIRKVLREHSRIIFSGDGYNDEWVKEAEKRGLSNLKTTPEALIHYTDPKNMNLFLRHHVYNVSELHARQNILLENYSHIVEIEAKTMEYMVSRQILPAVMDWQSEMTSLLERKAALNLPGSYERKMVTEAAELADKACLLGEELNKVLQECPKEVRAEAFYCSEVVLPLMNRLREVCDRLETIVPSKHWPMPDYNEILFAQLEK